MPLDMYFFSPILQVLTTMSIWLLFFNFIIGDDPYENPNASCDTLESEKSLKPVSGDAQSIGSVVKGRSCIGQGLSTSVV